MSTARSCRSQAIGLPTTIEKWYATWQNVSNPHLTTIRREHGPRLLSLPCDLIWATAWMSDANVVISPLLGLPELPVADLGELPGLEDPVWAEDRDAGLNWKTRGVVRRAAGRAFVWIDDELTDFDRSWVADHHGGHALLHRVDPARGLTDADLTTVGRWLDAL